MILVSIRKNFNSTTDFSDQDAIREIAKPQLSPFTSLTAEQLAERLRGKRCLVLVHGYRNQALAAVKAYWRVQEMLRATGIFGSGGAGYEEIIGYLWPGGWARIGFPIAVMRANRSAKRFEKLLLSLGGVGAALDVQTHSLGARVALEALDRERVKLRNLQLTAPAVDDESVEQGKEYAEAARACGALYVFHSKNDRVLKAVYRLGDFPEFDRALGYKGPQHPKRILANSKVVDCQDVVREHGGYRDAPEYFDYWRAELAGPGSPQFVRLRPKR